MSPNTPRPYTLSQREGLVRDTLARHELGDGLAQAARDIITALHLAGWLRTEPSATSSEELRARAASGEPATEEFGHDMIEAIATRQVIEDAIHTIDDQLSQFAYQLHGTGLIIEDKLLTTPRDILTALSDDLEHELEDQRITLVLHGADHHSVTIQRARARIGAIAHRTGLIRAHPSTGITLPPEEAARLLSLLNQPNPDPTDIDLLTETLHDCTARLTNQDTHDTLTGRHILEQLGHNLHGWTLQLQQTETSSTTATTPIAIRDTITQLAKTIGLNVPWLSASAARKALSDN